MIAVLADDFSGAAEVAGAAAARGFSAEVQTQFEPASDADVIVVDTDTRSLPPAEAARRVSVAARGLAAARPALVFKKIDSVLRGPVLAELAAAMEAIPRRRCLLASANPSRGRIVRDGVYTIDGRPLAETGFAADPEHPAASSEVLELLGATPGIETRRLLPCEPLPESGVVLPDVETTDDLLRLASLVDETTLPAGGVEFFEALLQMAVGLPSPSPAVGHLSPISASESGTDSPPRNKLLVCGSAAAWQASRRREAEQAGAAVFTMPPPLFAAAATHAALGAWAAEVALAVAERRFVMLAIGTLDNSAAGTLTNPRELVGRLVRIVEMVLERTRVDELYVEGGTTASTLARHLGWRRFRVSCPLAPGTTQLTVVGPAAPLLCIKPGSYDWPASIWHGGSQRTGG